MEDSYTIVSNQYVMGWGTLALINTVLAQSKNRSGLIWFFASLFFGPLATLVMCFIEKVPEKDKRF